MLAKLCPDAGFKNAEIHEIYVELGRLHGRWSAEQSRLNVAPLQAALEAIGKSLNRISTTFAAHQTGLREIHDIAVVSQLKNILAASPEIGSRQRADELIAVFQKDAATLADACRVAGVDFGWAKGTGGRPKLEWYNDFTALLLGIARRAGVKPTFGKDWVSDARIGWLVRAARELETFFDSDMQSPDDEARGKRLERSRRAIKQQMGQNPSRI